MSAPVEFHFDFSSPYAYFTSFRIDELAGRFGRTVAWRPYLMGAALKRSGRPIPLATEAPDSPEKTYLRHDCERTARLDKRAFAWPAVFPVNGLHAARLFYWQSDRSPQGAVELARAMFHAVFGEGRNIGDPNVALDVAVSRGFDRAEAASALADEAVKGRLRDATQAAIAQGIFGSPVIVIDGEQFWGNDRLWMVKRWLDWGGW